MSFRRKELIDAKRIVVKVGTSTLTYDTGKANFSRIDKLSMALADLSNQGKEVVLVTSGAIGIGMGRLNLNSRPKSIREKQAVASVGQCELMHIYSKSFSEYGHVVGQILLTRDIVGDREGSKNVINTFETLLKMKIIPIVNENDSVAVAEIKAGQKDSFRENDTLAAIVAKLIKADVLIMLSDIEGLYDCDPRVNIGARLLPVVAAITPEIEQCAGGAGTQRGTGGMATKLSAARIATSAGIHTVITNGNHPEIVLDILEGKDIGTLFCKKEKRNGST